MAAAKKSHAAAKSPARGPVTTKRTVTGAAKKREPMVEKHNGADHDVSATEMAHRKAMLKKPGAKSDIKKQTKMQMKDAVRKKRGRKA
jgi:hypothetical protein